MIHVLTIAGSDGSGGAGIQGDIKTIAAHGCHGLSVITAITAQNTTSISSVLTVNNVKDQLEVLMADIKIEAVKIGMIYEADQVQAISDCLKEIKAPVVYDPVMVSSTGKPLMAPSTKDKMLTELLPKVTLLTPNKSEAEILASMKITTKEDVVFAAEYINTTYGCSVLVKGGHLIGEKASDLLYLSKGHFKWLSSKRLEAKHTHGTGCCLSSAIACQLACGKGLMEAVSLAKAFTYEAIRAGYSIGAGEGPVDSILHRVRSLT